MVLQHDQARHDDWCNPNPQLRGALRSRRVFVARENAAAEDDGWLMVLVYDAKRDTSDLVILDANDIAGDAVATIELPQRVPHGFHGNWVPDQDG